ncbi:MAG TPA: valine--tRNA ligase, partial [Legionellales bacterium]|nr:valine--tRNA ligase [Legionellales bacterium]
EKKWQDNWDSGNKFVPISSDKKFSIVIPPPNVTGSLHMGHALEHSIIDVITRIKRLQGYETLWVPGTDHAGIITQLLVENELSEKGVQKEDIGRENFISKVWEWKEKSGENISIQMRKLGMSCDWSRERFTMDEGLSTAVREVFIKLYEDGLIYKGTRMVNWDTELMSAVSDLEVNLNLEKGKLWSIKYKTEDSFLTISTTRPETLLGDTAVAVNPEDERYKNLIGKTAVVPLVNREVPIIADEYVDPEFGSGCVKITPSHDFNDYEIGEKHKLEFIHCINLDGTISNEDFIPKNLRGKDRFEARKLIVSDLLKIEQLEKEEDYDIQLPKGDRSKSILEPMITEQWFVKTETLAKEAIKAVETEEIKFIPKNWEKTYFEWMYNIQDWCISRQIWWGHRIPAWYDEDSNIYVGNSEKEIREKHKIPDDTKLNQDEDVLDTWFSSALWPFSTLGWPEKTVEFETFYPTSVLVTGFDIIFFWVARMIMMGLKFTNQVPFKDVIITGLIRDADGHKMSKSKGNVLDPLDIIHGITLDKLIEKRSQHLMLGSMKQTIIDATRVEFPQGIASFGADALRFTFCSLASTGRNIRFDLNRVQGYRNFCNKLWNAARYVLLNSDNEQKDLEDGAFQYSDTDLWILSRLQQVVADAHHHLNTYRFDLLANLLYDFTWYEYCDWYLELSKPTLNDVEALAPMKRGTRRTLVYVLDKILKLLHPIMPFITEEIWQRLATFTSQKTASLMLASFPKVNQEFINPALEKEISWLKDMIQALRTMRSEIGINPSVRIPLYIQHASVKEQQLIEQHYSVLTALGRLESLKFITTQSNDICASVVIGQLELLVPLANLIDKEAELKRLDKELAKLKVEMTRANAKLRNPNFMAKAPDDIILKEQQKLQQAQLAENKLLAHQQTILKI